MTMIRITTIVLYISYILLGEGLVTLRGNYCRTTTMCAIRNKKLTGNVIESFTARSKLQCISQCLATPACESFNYNAATKLCEVSDVLYGHEPTAMVDAPGFFYYSPATDNCPESGKLPMPGCTIFETCEEQKKLSCGHSYYCSCMPRQATPIPTKVTFDSKTFTATRSLLDDDPVTYIESVKMQVPRMMILFTSVVNISVITFYSDNYLSGYKVEVINMDSNGRASAVNCNSVTNTDPKRADWKDYVCGTKPATGNYVYITYQQVKQESSLFIMYSDTDVVSMKICEAKFYQ
ncbi:uncharacterized protein LOC135482753 [Lineus longissimus]|uniref:uncharacterized protein LOC135482753 n=1 Tax=Lineus longissimus TaxID=88925 RepID=UPI002B4C70DE